MADTTSTMRKPASDDIEQDGDRDREVFHQAAGEILDERPASPRKGNRVKLDARSRGSLALGAQRKPVALGAERQIKKAIVGREPASQVPTLGRDVLLALAAGFAGIIVGGLLASRFKSASWWTARCDRRPISTNAGLCLSMPRDWSSPCGSQ